MPWWRFIMWINIFGLCVANNREKIDFFSYTRINAPTCAFYILYTLNVYTDSVYTHCYRYAIFHQICIGFGIQSWNCLWLSRKKNLRFVKYVWRYVKRKINFINLLTENVTLLLWLYCYYYFFDASFFYVDPLAGKI